MKLSDSALFELSRQERRALRRLGVESARSMRGRVKREQRRRAAIWRSKNPVGA